MGHVNGRWSWLCQKRVGYVENASKIGWSDLVGSKMSRLCQKWFVYVENEPSQSLKTLREAVREGLVGLKEIFKKPTVHSSSIPQ